MELGGQGEVLRALRHGPFKVNEGGPGSGLKVHECSRYQISENPNSVQGAQQVAGLFQECTQFGLGEPVLTVCGWVVQQFQSHLEIPGHCMTEDPCMALSHQ